jgi:hypothetical protein
VLIVRPAVTEYDREEENEEQLLDEALLSELSSGEPAGR